MVRIILVVDVELDKVDWPKREILMKKKLMALKLNKPFMGQYVIRKTHMKGFRMKVENGAAVDCLLNHNMQIDIHNFEWSYVIQSESDFASIFFVDWPIELIGLLPSSLFP